MHCTHYKEMLSAFIDDQLSEKETAALSAHLVECEGCKEQIDTLLAIGDIFKKGEVFDDAPEPSSGFVAAVMAKVAFEEPISVAAPKTGRTKDWLAPIIEFFSLKPAIAGAAFAAMLIITAGALYFYPSADQPSLLLVSELRPNQVTTASDRDGGDLYNHARMGATYTVGGVAYQVDRTLEESF